MASVESVGVERPYTRIEGRIERPEQRSALRTSGRLGGGLLLLGAAALLGRASRGLGRRLVERRSIGGRVGQIAGDLGRGFVAGMAGTLAITTASTVDSYATEALRARREGRKASLGLANAIINPWSFSAGVVSKIFGITPTDSAHERRLSVMAHWEYGSTWGLSLPLIYAVGIRGPAAVGTVLAGQLTAEMLVMPRFELFPPPTQWGKQAIVSSVYQHAIYAVAAVSAYEWMRPRA